MRLCLLMPAYNAAAHLATVIEQARYYVPHIFVVDDGSTDPTGEKARACGADVRTHDRNRGKGVALRTGFQAVLDAGYDAVITLDADGQHDPREIPLFLERWRETSCPIIVGARTANRGAMPLHRRLNNGLVTAVGQWLCGQPVPDFQCGYRFLRAEALRAVHTETDGYETESEFLIQAGRLGFPIDSVPVSTIYNDAESHVRAFREMGRFTRLLFRSFSTAPPRSVLWTPPVS